MAVIVVGFAEALAAPEVVWSLRDAGHSVLAVGRRGARTPLRRLIDVTHVARPEDGAQQAVDEIAGVVASAGAHAFMPLDDASVWIGARLAERGLTVIGPVGEQAAFALDKQRQVELARAAGLGAIDTRIATPRELRDDPPAFPVVVKPAHVTAVHAGALVRYPNRMVLRADQLDLALAAFPDDESLLCQPFVPGRGHGIFGLATADGVRGWSAHERVRMMHPDGSGSSACASVPVDPGLRAAVEQMLTRCGWRGMFMVELLRTGDGEDVFMELNGRPWGSMALARRLGLEYPAWAAAAALGDAVTVAETAFAPEVVCRHLGRELVHLLTVLRGPRRPTAQAWPSRLRTTVDVLRVRRGDRWYNLRRGEWRFFAADAWTTVARELGGALR